MNNRLSDNVKEYPLVSRRRFLKYSGLLGLSLMGCSSLNKWKAQNTRPNILFLCIDDLNDWVGCMGGHPDAKTPNMDRLAADGMLFANAHCPAPLCAPSRTALLSGIAPYNSGVYKNRNRLKNSSELENITLMPECFKNGGYYVTGTGKIFHESDHEPDNWHEYWPAIDVPNPETYAPPESEMPLHGMPVPKNAWGNDFGSIPVSNEQTGDWKTAGWAAERLRSNEMPEPFFLAWGCKKPHVPLYAPQKYFDMYPLDKIKMPVILENDLDDVPQAGREIGSYSWPWKPHEYFSKYGKQRECVQAYLACVSYVDDCVGRVLKGLEESDYKDSTIVVLLSDHGMHKGEKQNWSKYTLWEEVTRVPMIFSGPGIKSGSESAEPVNLLDLYPTLAQICGLKTNVPFDGSSITDILANPKAVFNRISVTAYGPHLNSVRSRDWRYIRYADGSEELYNHTKDPYEWHNLASKPEFNAVKETLAAHIPEKQAPASRK
jgi:arylsulfatase A-like enzyme